MDPNELSRIVSARRAEQAARERRSPPESVRLGTLISTVMDGARWRGQNAFPSSQMWSDEVERVFGFGLSQDQFGVYLPRLRGRWNQFESALAELRVAFYLHRNQFRIKTWEPYGARGVRGEGEFSIAGPSGVPVFVEVKSPGWEGEVSEEEIRRGRLEQPKNLYCEARAVAPWMKIQFAIEKAYKKFRSDGRNLLVVADDLFVGLQLATEMHVGMALYEPHTMGCFTGGLYEKLGGVGVFWVENNGQEIWYEMRMYLNPCAIASCSIPEDMSVAFNGEFSASPQDQPLESPHSMV